MKSTSFGVLLEKDCGQRSNRVCTVITNDDDDDEHEDDDDAVPFFFSFSR